MRKHITILLCLFIMTIVSSCASAKSKLKASCEPVGKMKDGVQVFDCDEL